MSGKTRIFYRSSSNEVVIEADGVQIASYLSTEAMIETHIKGILAKDRQDSQKIRRIFRKYRPTDSIKS
jgi:hypothetical protein